MTACVDESIQQQVASSYGNREPASPRQLPRMALAKMEHNAGPNQERRKRAKLRKAAALSWATHVSFTEERRGGLRDRRLLSVLFWKLMASKLPLALASVAAGRLLSKMRTSAALANLTFLSETLTRGDAHRQPRERLRCRERGQGPIFLPLTVFFSRSRTGASRLTIPRMTIQLPQASLAFLTPAATKNGGL